MQCFFRYLSILFVSAVFPVCAKTIKETPVIKLTSLEWPPFTSATRFGGGMTTMVLEKALAAKGYHLEVEYLDWDAAVQNAVQQKSAGYFPEYYSKALNKRCVFSEAIGSSLVVLAHRAKEPLRWKSLDDLKSYKVGVVSGYVNEEQFDTAVTRGRIPSVESNSDIENLENLVNKKVDLAVIDRRVLGYWLRKSEKIKPYARDVGFHPAGLKEHGLYVCFTGPNAVKHAEVLNEGLKLIDPMGFGLGHDPMYKNMK